MKQIPAALITELKNLPGFSEKDFTDAHYETNKITSVRFNPFKTCEPEFKTSEKVSWCNSGFYLAERPSFTHDPFFHAGCYYVQEAGSMFLEYALKNTLDLNSPLKLLDLCGAPGGKSTLISSMISDESLLVSNEVVKSRAGILSYNLSKWGTANCVVTNSDPLKIGHLTSFFDAIVIDAPCSGSGLFRKQPEAIDEWTPELVEMCSARQKRIVADILPALKENGILIYSTCSYSEQENEANVKWLTENFDLEYLPLNVPASWNIVEGPFGYRFYPHLVKSEGFFCAVLRKKSGEYAGKKRQKHDFLLKNKEIESFSGHFSQKLGFFLKINQNIHFMNRAAMDFIHFEAEGLYIKKAGVCVGEPKGRELVFNHEAALYSRMSFPNRVDLDKETALKYLRKDALSLPGAAAGVALIQYLGAALGWGKILPNRVNNYLPSEIRILN